MESVLSRVSDRVLAMLAFQPPKHRLHDPAACIKTSSGLFIAVKYFTPYNAGFSSGLKSVIYSHGNACDIGMSQETEMSYCQWLADTFEVNVCSWDPVGYGYSQDGITTENNLKEAAEAVLLNLVKKNEITDKSVTLIGKSMGCVPTIHLGACEQTKKFVDGMVLISGFASGFRVYCPSLNLSSQIYQQLDKMFCPNIDTITQIDCHALIIHGTEDKIVHPNNATLLHDRLPLHCTMPVLFLDGGHADLEARNKHLFEHKVGDFLLNPKARHVSWDL